MAESSQATETSPEGISGLSNPLAAFEKLQELLKAKDDTSRFVGLALLKSLLDNGQLVQDPTQVNILWEALSPKFLDKLLRAQQNEKMSKSESKDMVELAVSVLHTFSILLPESSLKETRLTGRTRLLVSNLVQSSPETTKLILQTVLTIVSQPEGALEILRLEDFSPLTEIAPQYQLVLDIFGYAWSNASTINAQSLTVQENVDKVIPNLLLTFRQTDAVTLVESLGNYLSKIAPAALSPDPNWLVPLVSILRKLVTLKPTAAGRAAYTRLAAALLQAFPVQAPVLLFKNDISGNSESKPFSYLFVNLLLIDLRSSYPSLLSKLNSTEYPPISQRLAACFDVLSSFIGFLVRSLDDEKGILSFSLPPDLLLKLRKDIAETISLTIEYFRDRWDASVAGVSGLHPSARTGTAATSEGTRLTLTWDSMEDKVTEDQLILAGIRCLAIWIREDENENLRKETAGLMDMFLELYRASSRVSLDFRYPILLALEVLLGGEDDPDIFLNQDGWQILSEDLVSILQKLSGVSNLADSNTLAEAARGLEIVRVLLAIVDHQSISFPKEEWMEFIKSTTSLKAAKSTPPALVLEVKIASIQLSTALLSKAAKGVQKRFVTSVSALVGLSSQLRLLVKELSNAAEASELSGLLDDALLELQSLRLAV